MPFQQFLNVTISRVGSFPHNINHKPFQQQVETFGLTQITNVNKGIIVFPLLQPASLHPWDWKECGSNAFPPTSKENYSTWKWWADVWDPLQARGRSSQGFEGHGNEQYCQLVLGKKSRSSRARPAYTVSTHGQDFIFPWFDEHVLSLLSCLIGLTPLWHSMKIRDF